ncbi:PEP/pyruvate-binding domain-containing protein [Accumulibacter sp.]|uniref:PEP/pyruvate-binding domain-containing protein n=1 Tax=Accumulibacter sp. TaxID=2053492 RepID=UPI001AC25BAE|nr:PEP/pyruvate-binding domain-containing protein [Accumulibacter sp.]MBN8451538.1 pyruvate, phosphate dikinase [Accumulibacter sp.]
MAAASVSPRPLFLFGGKVAASRPGSIDEMGFKAFNLMAMTAAGLPVPPGFVLTTGFARQAVTGAGSATSELRAALADGVRHIERESGLGFGARRRPLLVSVRSGAPVSMPGMMETLLDVGVNDLTVDAIIRSTGNPRLAWDCYRRLVQGFAEVVHDCPANAFASGLEECMRACGASSPREIDFRSLTALTRDYLALFEELTGEPFPQDPMLQLEQAAVAVVRSWHSEKAVTYRRARNIGDSPGTAMTVQRMVFGNAGGMSGAGVAFTRDPSTGANELYMDFLFNAQGEDVVSGRHALADEVPLATLLPDTRREIEAIAAKLETEFGDAQEFEFTVEDGKLFMLQTRAAKRTPLAALRIAVDLVAAGLIDPAAALAQLQGIDLAALEELRLARPDELQLLASATPAGIGIAVGRLVLDVEAAERLAAAGDPVLLLRHETATADIAGIAISAGILTAVGGRTSHAAVVARQLGKVCLVGCRELVLDLQARRCRIGGHELGEGDWLCLDGNAGHIHAGRPEVVGVRPDELLQEVEKWRRGLATGGEVARAA